MSIEPITADSTISGGVAGAGQAAATEQSVQQTAAGEQSGFSEILSQTSGGTLNLDAIFEAAAEKYNVSANLLKAVAKAESGFQPNATSKSGAMGIMQLMPGTARGLGVTDAYDPEQNIMGGAKFLRQLLDQFDGDVQLALAGYNAGPNNVVKYGGIPPFTETQNYVRKVMEYFGGGDIAAGMAMYSGGTAGVGMYGSGEGEEGAKSSLASLQMTAAFKEMLLVKLIEMQMSSSKDDEDKPKVF